MRTAALLAPPIRAIQPRSLRDQIVEVLQDAIISGEYRPGQRLVEREFVNRFGVSSIPVREALQELETRGLVVKRHNRGCTVINLSMEQQQHMCALRLLIEPTVVEWAGQQFSAESHREPLLHHLDRLVAAARANDHAEYFRQDMFLHRFLWEMSGNEYATRSLEPVVGSLFAMGLMRVKESKVDLKKEADRHVQLVNAILRKQPKSAAKALQTIINHYEAALSASVAQSRS
jgi:DNA-binding GntR family transcriptional regulator